MENVVMKAGNGTYDRIFRAIGDPHRIQIMELLREKELSAGEILEAIDVVQSTLSHHMKTLVESGAVNASRRGKWTYYSLNQENLKDAAGFLDDFAKGTKVLTEKASQNAESPKTGSSSPVQILKSLENIDEEPEKKVTAKPVKDDAPEIAEASDKSEKKKSKKNKKNKKNKKKDA